MTSIREEGHQLLELCDLPDEVLIRILTLLPTTDDAVRTCLLLLRRNEQQQHLWKSLTCLKFSQRDDFWFKRWSHFFNFVDKVMHLRDHSVPLVSFSIKCLIKEENDADDVRTWITKAVQCNNIEEITLSIHDTNDIGYETGFLPSCTFRCQTLVKMDLEYITFDVPSSSVVCLPLLKYLGLYEVRLVDDESTEMLLSSPLIEELIIQNCSWRWIESIRVCSPKLQVLKIWDRNSDDGDNYSAKVCIIGENLKYFFYIGRLINKYRVCASSSTQLTKVEIYVEEINWKFCRVNCCDILKGFYRTRNLILSDYFLQGLQIFPKLLDTIQVFESVTRLDIRVYNMEMSIDSLVLMKIYEKCPHLEYLNIANLSETKGNSQLSPIPLCFQTSLKKIMVRLYVPGDRKADAAIDVLLNSAFVLEELVIYCLRDTISGFHEDGHKAQRLQDRLNQRPRISKDCTIIVKYLSSWSYYTEYYLNQ